RAAMAHARMAMHDAKIERQGSQSKARQIVDTVRIAWQRALLACRSTQFIRSAPVIGKAVLQDAAHSDLVLLVALRVEGQGRRLEVVATAHPVLLSLALRCVAWDVLKRSTVAEPAE